MDPETGLSAEEAARRLDAVGPNRIEEDTGPGLGQLLLRQFKDVLVLILIVAAIVSGAVLGDFLEAAVIMAIVVLNAAIGFVQEWKAADAAEGLRRMTSAVARVIREGEERLVPTENIVPGDIIVVETGDRVFADARLIETTRLQADESELTGESTPVDKTVGPVEAEVGVADRSSVVHSGTVVVAGHGKGVVTATGGDSEIGRIADMLREEEPPTPLERELTHVGKRLGILAGAIALVVMLIGLGQGRTLESMFLLAVALAVAAIPEGLPAVVGVTLGVGVQKMAERNAIVRRMPAVEALGAVTVICTDKTGTLTRNEIRVQEARLGTGSIEDLESRGDEGRVRRLAEIAVLCSDARATEDGWQGDPTEIALLRWASELLDPKDVRSNYSRVDEIPFESARMRMTTLHRWEDGFLLAVKGAPEVIIPRCGQIEAAEGVADLDDERADEWLDAAKKLAGKGLRTMVLAYRMLSSRPADLDSVEDDLTLVAVVGMSDQLRDEAKSSVDEAMGAGVTVVMITGDHEVTARAVAEGLELLDARKVMVGRTLRSLGDPEFEEEVDDVGVYARVDPGDKVRIVRAWQKQGEIVAMTGDGVNDAPALRIADIGVAMGSGTDVARDASDIVLADDNFATIVAAVRSGRTIFANIRKVISFLLAANVSEVIVVFVGFLLFASYGDPLLATQILWVNLVTDGLPAIALGFDPPDSRVMQRPPTRRRSLLSRESQVAIGVRGALLAVAVLSAFFYGIAQGADWEMTRTLGFTVLVLVQLSYVYALRITESGWREGLLSNRLLHGAVLVSLILQVLVVMTPSGNRLFETVALSMRDWLLAGGLAVLGGLVVVAVWALLPSLREER